MGKYSAVNREKKRREKESQKRYFVLYCVGGGRGLWDCKPCL